MSANIRSSASACCPIPSVWNRPAPSAGAGWRVTGPRGERSAPRRSRRCLRARGFVEDDDVVVGKDLSVAREMGAVERMVDDDHVGSSATARARTAKHSSPRWHDEAPGHSPALQLTASIARFETGPQWASTPSPPSSMSASRRVARGRHRIKRAASCRKGVHRRVQRRASPGTGTDHDL